jgi:hypothetical protein
MAEAEYSEMQLGSVPTDTDGNKTASVDDHAGTFDSN